jgi:arabinose-5-phosphate isomerase
MRSAGPVARSELSGDLVAARRVLDYATDAIRALGTTLNGDFTRAIDTILAARGRVIVSGMGKSGHVGRKIAATLASTGTPAQFVHPGEASHGDLGMVTKDDVLLMLSNSGETRELSDLITFAKRFSIPIVGIASRADSTLMQASDVALVLPKFQEACSIGMAPTTSTTLTLVLGDALAVALMERRSFSADQYRELHPGGALGKALIRVSDLMHGGEEMPIVAESASMQDVVLEMATKRFGCVGIVDSKGALAGMITDGDLARHMDRGLLDRKPADVMTRAPKTVMADKLAAEALAFMNEKKISQLFVLGAGGKSKKPTGILHLHDCLKAGLE